MAIYLTFWHQRRATFAHIIFVAFDDRQNLVKTQNDGKL
jgi:hypothetical protein